MSSLNVLIGGIAALALVNYLSNLADSGSIGEEPRWLIVFLLFIALVCVSAMVITYMGGKHV